MINRLWGDELVLDKERRRYLAMIENIEAEPNQVFSVPFREVGNRPDQASLRNPEFGATFGRGVLSHNGTAVAASGFFESAQCSERAWAVDRCHQHMV